MKDTEQYFPVVLFIMLYKVVLTFESVDEILKCDHSIESFWAAVLPCGAVYYAVQGGSNVWVCGWNPKVWPFKWKLLSYYYYAVHWGGSYFWFCGKIPKCDNFNESYWLSYRAVLTFLWYHFLFCIWGGFDFCFFVGKSWSLTISMKVTDWATKQYLSRGTVYYTVRGGSNFWVCGWNPKAWPLKWKLSLLSSPFYRCCLFCMCVCFMVNCSIAKKMCQTVSKQHKKRNTRTELNALFQSVLVTCMCPAKILK